MTEICLKITDNLFDELEIWQKYKPEDLSFIEADWFKERLDFRLPVDTGVFPFDLRWVSPNGLGAIFEVPAGHRVITFTNADQYVAGKLENPVHDIVVWAPRTVIGVILDKSSWSPVTVWTYVITEPLKSKNQKLYVCPLPNLYADARVCLPSSDRRFDQYCFAHGLFSAYESVWDTRYNTDLLDLLKSVRSNCRPAAIWDGIQKTYDLRRETLIQKGVAQPHRFKGTPSGTPFQVLQAWGRLKPEEVDGITDWVHNGETLDTLIGTINRYSAQEPTSHSLFAAIRESVGM